MEAQLDVRLRRDRRAFVLYSIPAFVLGFVLLDVFSFHLR